MEFETSSSYCKLILHSLKYPTQSVFGVLLGDLQNKLLSVVDTIPLFHGNFLSPMLEVALSKVCFDLLLIALNMKCLWM